MNWFVLALIAPFLYSIVNLIDDNMMRFIYKGPYLATTVTSLFASVSLLSLFFVKFTPIPIHLAWLAILVGFLTSLNYFFYFKALEVEQPAVIVALFGLVPATLPLLSHFFLGEDLVLRQLVGIAIIVFGSFGLAAIEVRKFKFSSALAPMLAAVGLLDVVSLLSKYAYDRAPFYPVYMYMSVGIVLGGLYFPLVMFYSKTQHDLSMLKKKLGKVFWVFLLSECLALAAAFTSNLAVSRGPLSIVRVIEGVQPVYVLLIALSLYRFSPKHFREIVEGRLIRKFTLMAVIITGIALVYTN